MTSGYMLLVVLFTSVVDISTFEVIQSFTNVSHSFTNVSHVIMHEDYYYIGGLNFIAQLDLNYSLVSNLSTKPADGADNRVRILTVNPDTENTFLLFCGTADNGRCSIFNIDGIQRGNHLDSSYFIDEYLKPDEASLPKDNIKLKMAKYGVFGYLGSQTSNEARFIDIRKNTALHNHLKKSHILITSSTWDYRDTNFVPALGFYSVKNIPDSNNYYMRPTYMNMNRVKFSWLTPPPQLNYSIIHQSIISYRDVILTVSVQQNLDHPTKELETRVGRLNSSDIFFASYIEAPVRCSSEIRFNIAIDVKIVSVTQEMANQTQLLEGEDVLIFLQASDKPNIPDTAICMLSLSKVMKKMDRAIERCKSGKGRLARWYHNEENNCSPLAQLDVNTGIAASMALPIPSVITAPAFTAEIITVLESTATMIHLMPQGNTSVAFVGMKSGYMVKVNLASGSIITQFRASSTTAEISKKFVDEEDSLLVAAGDEIVKVPVGTCGIYKTVSQCASSSDPLSCGWCDGISCTSAEECWKPERWYNGQIPPTISSFEPHNSSVTGGTILSITGIFTQEAKTSVTVESLTAQLPCKVITVDSDRLTCETSSSEGEVHGKISVTQMIGDKFYTGESTGLLFFYKSPKLLSFHACDDDSDRRSLIAIHGENLNTGNTASLQVGRRSCKILSHQADLIKCEVRGRKLSGGLLVNITLIVDDHYQVAIPGIYNPEQPLSLVNSSPTSFFSGGSEFCLNHISASDMRNCHVTWQLMIDSTISAPHISQSCIYRDGLVCSITPDIAQRVQNRMSLKVKAYLNLDGTVRTIPDFTYYGDPVVYKLLNRTPIAVNGEILIKGERFEYGETSEYTVKIDDRAVCLVTFRTRSTLKCQLAHPDLVYSTTIEEQSLQVTVHYAHFQASAGTIVLSEPSIATVGSSRNPSEPTPESDQDRIIVILSIFFGLSIFTCLVVIAVVLKRRRKRPDDEKSSNCTRPRNAYHRSLGGANELIARVEGSKFWIDRSQLTIGDELGSGCFGSVFRGTLVEKHGDEQAKLPIAIKTIKGVNISVEQSAIFLDEALLMGTFKHENVLSLTGICFDSNNQPMVVLPFMSGGDLLTYLRNPSNTINVEGLLRFALDIATGMSYLEHVLCVHRDLAARNCMLDANLNVKVADFGLSRDLFDFKEIYLSLDNKTRLPVKWMAPESIKSRQFSPKSDMWSYGVTLWEIFTRGLSPYAGINFHELMQYIEDGHRLDQPECCPNEIYELMCSTWSINDEERPGFAQVLSDLHLYLNNSDSGEERSSTSSDGSVSKPPVEDYLQPIMSTV